MVVYGGGKMNHLVAPSILSADFGHLNAVIDLLNESEADWIHCDIMDGLFVPNLSFGFPVLEAIAKRSQKPLDFHLMIVDPDRYIEAFARLQPHVITVHYEGNPHLHRTLMRIKAFGILAGVAFNPATPVSHLEAILPYCDLICVMGVNPGFGGQTIIPTIYDKLQQLVALQARTRSKGFIEVDGGVGEENALSLLQAGANVLVAGSSVFHHPEPKQMIAFLKQLRPHQSHV